MRHISACLATTFILTAIGSSMSVHAQSVPETQPAQSQPSESTLTTLSLLTLFEPKRDALAGSWIFDLSTLRSTAPGRIRFPYRAGFEYEINLDCTVFKGNGAIQATFPTKGGMATWTLNENQSKLQLGETVRTFTPEKSEPPQLLRPREEPVQARIQVLPDKVNLWIGDLLAHTVAINKTYPMAADPKTGNIVLQCFPTEVRITEFSVTEEKAKDKVVFKSDLTKIRYGVVPLTSSMRPILKSSYYRVNSPDDSTTVTINGKPASTVMFDHAPSTHTYTIPEGAVRFRAYGAWMKDFPHTKTGNWRYIILIDDKQVLVSKSIQESKGLVVMDIPIPAGASKITLQVDAMGDAGYDWAYWANLDFFIPLKLEPVISK